jgi:hypothetical protein
MAPRTAASRPGFTMHVSWAMPGDFFLGRGSGHQEYSCYQ